MSVLANMAQNQLRRRFPSLAFVVLNSASRYRHFCIGVRQREDEGLYTWLYEPIDNFPTDDFLLKLTLIA